MLRIAQLIESDGPGGAERVVADLATNLQAAGAETVVFVPANGEGWLARQLVGSGVEVEHFHLDTPVSPASARSLAAALRRRRIDVAHSHEFSMAVYGAWASWLARVQHVITMHGSRYYAMRAQRRVAMRAAIAMSRRTVAVSRRLANQMSHDLLVARSRIEIIPNGVHAVPADGSAVREELRLGPDDRLVVTIGNLYPVKGHVHLIDAMALLAGRHPRLQLAICGRGDLEDALRSRANARGIGNRVHLLGLRTDVAAVLAAADLFALPSLSEGLPLALLEAMFAGRPIVASDVGEVSAALGGNEAGVLVAPGNSSALASALDALLIQRNLARNLGARARARACALYDFSNMVRKYSAIYDQVLTPARPPAERLVAGSRRAGP
jgi:glycosyltransferase involved in cell wall biosynthesis